MMKKMRNRLFFHFTVQFVFITLLMGSVIFLTLIIGLNYIAKYDREQDYYQAQLDELVIEIGDPVIYQETNGNVGEVLPDDTWLQVIDEKGNVIESEHVPESVQNEYDHIDILQMKERNQVGEYAVKYSLEEPSLTSDEQYLFVLGYKEEGALLMNTLTEDVNTNGSIPADAESSVENDLNDIEGSLTIYNEDGNEIQTFGAVEDTDTQLLENIEKDTAPDYFSEHQYTYLDRETGNTWVLTAPNLQNQTIPLNTFKNITLFVLGLAGVVLAITLLISFWNSFRYGRPLFLFTDWLKHMENGEYIEFLTEKEKKKVYRKNGKLKRKFKLYKEVFQAFDHMTQKLDAAKKEREQLEKSRTEWISGVSHDLRTPLTTVEGYGRLLENENYEWSPQELKNIGGVLSEKSTYMVQLLDDFMLSTQLKNYRENLKFNQMNINEFMKETLTKYEKDITFNGYPLEFEQTNAAFQVEVNERLFERMIDNLMYNAVKHNPSGTTIKVIIIGETEKLNIQIVDNGSGMDEDTKRNLFDRYYRGTNTEEHSEGTGLGMSIALQIAKLHNGSITVQSETGIGTVMTVTLPYKKD